MTTSGAKLYQVENSRSNKVIDVGYFIEMQGLCREANKIDGSASFICTDATEENIALKKDGKLGFGVGIVNKVDEDNTAPDAPRTVPSEETPWDYDDEPWHSEYESASWMHDSRQNSYKKNYTTTRTSLTVRERVAKYLKNCVKTDVKKQNKKK